MMTCHAMPSCYVITHAHLQALQSVPNFHPALCGTTSKYASSVMWHSISIYKSVCTDLQHITDMPYMIHDAQENLIICYNVSRWLMHQLCTWRGSPLRSGGGREAWGRQARFPDTLTLLDPGWVMLCWAGLLCLILDWCMLSWRGLRRWVLSGFPGLNFCVAQFFLQDCQLVIFGQQASLSFLYTQPTYLSR